MMPILLRLREYVEAANVARERARSERKSQAKQVLQEIERCYRRLVEVEKWAVDQQQYNRPFAHFGLFNGHAAQTSAREDIVSRSADQEWGLRANARKRSQPFPDRSRITTCAGNLKRLGWEGPLARTSGCKRWP
jgi:hypothetical protein